ETLVLSDLETVIVDMLRVPREQIHADENFSELGFDSVSLAKLSRTLGERLAIDVLPSVFFSFPTPQKLVAHLLAEHRGALGQHYAVRSAASTGAPPPSVTSDVKVSTATAEDRSGAASIPQTTTRTEPEPIAIIGMSGRFPAARSVDEFWRNLLQGKDAL